MDTQPVETINTPLHKAAVLFNQAFERPRDPRSMEYKRGVLYILLFKSGAVHRTPCPFPEGSAQADAWHSGTQEGHSIWRQSLGHPGRVAGDAL